MNNDEKKAKKTKKVKRYAEANKAKLLSAYQELRNKGTNASVAAKTVGVPYITLRTWQKNSEMKAKPQRKLAKSTVRRVKAAKSKKQKQSTVAPVTLVLPNGTRVECASVADAVKFLKTNQ